ncbi:hypothetical protein EYF80_025750 [Liparis tanakae]|uniref:Uncharacterized protein n=1 Tax=Liparis tanakae TaxID=230148 RepID=A0A4Z2HDT0_9TELE|nr:hypothetical protein EYF80_025750 [Liparis tanakae]
MLRDLNVRRRPPLAGRPPRSPQMQFTTREWMMEQIACFTFPGYIIQKEDRQTESYRGPADYPEKWTEGKEVRAEVERSL